MYEAKKPKVRSEYLSGLTTIRIVNSYIYKFVPQYLVGRNTLVLQLLIEIVERLNLSYRELELHFNSFARRFLHGQSHSTFVRD